MTNTATAVRKATPEQMQNDELVSAVARLREQKARERCAAIGEDPDSGVTPWADDREPSARLWQIYASPMDDLLAIIPLVLEHAAVVVDDAMTKVRAKVYMYPQCQPNEAMTINALAEVAAAIRSAA